MKSLLLLILAIIVNIATSHLSTCYSQGDPHYRTFSGRAFDNMWEGTVLLAETKSFVVHAKTGVWNRNAAVNIATGVLFEGNRYVIEDKYNNEIKVNGVNYKLNHGKNVVEGLVVEKQGSQLFLRAGQEFVQVQTNYDASWKRAYSQDIYQNIAIFGEVKPVGICGDQGVQAAKGIFEHDVAIKIIDTAKCFRKHKKIAHEHCLRKFGAAAEHTQGFEWCVFDVCRGLKAEWVEKWEDEVLYFKEAIEKYEHLKSEHQKLAKEYLKKALKHLEHTRFHSKQYQEHARQERYWEQARNENRRKREQSEKDANNSYEAREKADKEREKYLDLAEKFKDSAAHFNELIKHANDEIKRCQNHIQEEIRKRTTAFNQFTYFNNKALSSLKEAEAHKRAYESHHKAYLAHKQWEEHYGREESENEKKRNYHAQMAEHHRRESEHHKSEYEYHKNQHEEKSQKADEYAKHVANFNQKLRDSITKKENAEKNQITVIKTIREKSDECEGTPSYLDGIEYVSAEQARNFALQACQHSDKNVFYSCVYDHAKGLFNTKKEYIELANLLKENDKRYTCYSVGDPHNKPFIGPQFDVYHTEGWGDILKTNDVHIKAFVKYQKQWGTRGLNKYVQVTLPDDISVTFEPNGHVVFHKCSPWRTNFNYNHAKEWENTLGHYHVKITWETSLDGGYYNVYITTNLGSVRNCQGVCCNTATYQKNIERRIQNGDPLKVEFESPCERKARAYDECAVTYSHVNDQAQKKNEIVKCVLDLKNK